MEETSDVGLEKSPWKLCDEYANDHKYNIETNEAETPEPRHPESTPSYN